MTTPFRRRRPTAPAFVVEHITQHWRLIGGRWYRDAVVVLPDGRRRVYAFPEVAA